MKFYVSTSSKRLEDAKGAMDQVRIMGHEVTFDWTEVIERESSFSPYRLREMAINDIDGIKSADAVIVIMYEETDNSVGTMIEIGAALALDKPVIVAEVEVPFDHFFSRLCKSALDVVDAVEFAEELHGKVKI